MNIDIDAVRTAAGSVRDPEIRRLLTDMGLLDEIQVNEDRPDGETEKGLTYESGCHADTCSRVIRPRGGRYRSGPRGCARMDCGGGQAGYRRATVIHCRRFSDVGQPIMAG